MFLRWQVKSVVFTSVNVLTNNGFISPLRRMEGGLQLLYTSRIIRMFYLSRMCNLPLATLFSFHIELEHNPAKPKSGKKIAEKCHLCFARHLVALGGPLLVMNWLNWTVMRKAIILWNIEALSKEIIATDLLNQPLIIKHPRETLELTNSMT